MQISPERQPPNLVNHFNASNSCASAGQGGNLVQTKLTALNGEIANSMGSCKSGSKSENFSSRELINGRLLAQVSKRSGLRSFV